MADLTNEQIELIVKVAQRAQPMFGRTPQGGPDDNSDIIKAIKESDEKAERLAKDEAKLFNKLKKELNIKDDIKSLHDVIKIQDQSKKYAAFAKQMKDAASKKFESQAALEEELKNLEEAAKAAGTTLKKEGVEMFKPLATLADANQKQTYIIRDGIKQADKKIKKSEEELKSIEEVIRKRHDLSLSYDVAKNRLDKFTGAVRTITKEFLKLAEEEQRFMQATATADAGWVDGLMQMQISQIEYAKILKQTRHEGLAALSANVNFKESLSESADSLQGLTSNYGEAAKGAAMFHKNMARIGVSQDKLGDAVLDQTKIYKENYRALGYTVEEFANLTNELINDQGMRSTLLALQESERKQYVLNIQQRQAEYLAMGYTIDRAKELQKTFQALNKMNPKERMKQAAKTRAMMGAMGMGAQGEELFRLQTTYRTMNADQKADAEKRMTEIQGQAAEQFGTMSGAGVGLGQSMAFQMMADKTGFAQIAETFEVASGKGLQVEQDQLGVLHEINKGIKAVLGGVDIWQAASNSALSSIATGVISIAGAILTGMLAKKLGGAIIGKMMGGGMGGGMMKGVVGAAAAAKGAGATGLGMAAKGAGAAGKIGLAATKTAGKAALKAIPGIGLIASLGLMGSRLAQGDVMGAGMELASGAMGLVPGIGTAGSIAMSGAIAARDLSSSAGPQEAPEMMAIEPETEAKSPNTTLIELNKTLQQLQEFLLTTTDANIEQAKSLGKVSKSLDENIRMGNVLDARSAS